ncbi:hypothetical protein QS257_17045 [Terrilactibacillus sp. S3-3]|nr:hypothetical protein QS257_17045 [Terrilactibacillus sp. S3-3]
MERLRLKMERLCLKWGNFKIVLTSESCSKCLLQLHPFSSIAYENSAFFSPKNIISYRNGKIDLNKENDVK